MELNSIPYSMKTPDVIQLLRANSPITICNGKPLQMDDFFEPLLMSWLATHKISFEIEDNLYHRSDYNLSKYRTICFSRTEGASNDNFEELKKSFPKENLKLVIVGSILAYEEVKILAEKLHIDLLQFEGEHVWGWFYEARDKWKNSRTLKKIPELGDYWKKNPKEELFFDPKVPREIY